MYIIYVRWEEPVEMSMMSEMRAEESPAELREKECGRKWVLTRYLHLNYAKILHFSDQHLGLGLSHISRFKNCMPIQEGIEGSGSNFKQIITCTEKNYFLAQVTVLIRVLILVVVRFSHVT